MKFYIVGVVAPSPLFVLVCDGSIQYSVYLINEILDRQVLLVETLNQLQSKNRQFNST